MRLFLCALVACQVACSFHVEALGFPVGDGGSAGELGPSEDLLNPPGSVDLQKPPGSVDLQKPPVQELRININGAQHSGIDYPGLWAADPGTGGACSGTNYVNFGDIHGTSDDALFIGEVFGPTVTCKVGGGLLTAGNYQVNLYFAEIFFGPGCPDPVGGVGSRRFDIELEGATVLSGLDIFQEGGCAASVTSSSGHPVVKTFMLPINDKTLDIKLVASTSNAKISAIELIGPL